MRNFAALALFLAVAGLSEAQKIIPLYQQCGGIGFKTGGACTKGSYCESYGNAYWSQCVPKDYNNPTGEEKPAQNQQPAQQSHALIPDTPITFVTSVIRATPTAPIAGAPASFTPDSPYVPSRPTAVPACVVVHN
jgi:hypothetical protein